MNDWSEIKRSVYDNLSAEDGWMIGDGYWPSNILQDLVAEGFAHCEVRVGIPTYWKVETAVGEDGFGEQT